MSMNLIAALGLMAFAMVQGLVWSDVPGSRNGAAIVVFADSPDAENLAGMLREDGHRTRLIDAAELYRINAIYPNLLIVGPGTKVPPASREAIHRFRVTGGNVAVLEPSAFQYPNRLIRPVPVVDLSRPDAVRILTSKAGANEPSVELTPERAGSGSANAIRVTTRLVGDGDVLVEIPLKAVRSKNRSVLGFEAKGGPGVAILYLAIHDDRNRRWVSFVEVGSAWRAFELGLEDFLPDDSGGDGTAFLEPDQIEVLRIGMLPHILWPEQGGSFSIGEVVLGEGSRQEFMRTATLAPWRVQFERLGVPFPEWVWDPFWESEEVETGDSGEIAGFGNLAFYRFDGIAGRVWTVPNPPHERGREHAPFATNFDPGDLQRRSLATVRDEAGDDIVVAEWRRFNDGTFAGGSLFLSGAPGEDLSAGNPWGELVRAVVNRTVVPMIVRTTPVLPRAPGNESSLAVRVVVANPTREMIDAHVAIRAGPVSGNGNITLAAVGETSLDVPLSEVPADFSWERFESRVELTVDGNLVDSLIETIEVGELMHEAARYLLRVQEHHGDGRFSHHFFSDQYSARFLFGFARLLEPAGGAERLGLRVEREEIERFREGAFRFGDMIVRRQKQNGSFPMGYFEHRDFVYVADLGQVCLGMVQMASWLDEGDPRREQYLNVVRRYFDFRQSFLQTQERVARLEVEHGPDPKSIREGFYGLGYLDLDYFGNGRWEKLRREERGPWWVLPVSLGFLGGLMQIDDDPRVREVALTDTRFYLNAGFEITQVAHFHAESLFWMLYGIEDPALRQRIAAKLGEELPPRFFRGVEYPYFPFQGRAAIWPISAVYAWRYLEDSPAWRAVLLAGLLTAGDGSSSKSMKRVAQRFPYTTYGPSLGAYRYVAFSAFWMLDLVDEGSSLMRDRPFPPSGGWSVR